MHNHSQVLNKKLYRNSNKHKKSMYFLIHEIGMASNTKSSMTILVSLKGNTITEADIE